MNALSIGLLEELLDAVAAAGHEDEVGALVITGSPEAKRPAFAAGADIEELAEMDVLALRAHSRLGQAVFTMIEELTMPVIAAVNGFALGGGCELAMACHVRYASDKASFGQPEIDLGLIPGFGGTQRLPRIVGRGRALELLLTGARIDAAEALRIGLVNKVLPHEELMGAVMELARAIASKAPLAREFILDAVGRGGGLPVADGQGVEADLFGMLAGTEDTKEGLAAFIEKRKPTWIGR
jgi:enoyl-CoA hydratase